MTCQRFLYKLFWRRLGVPLILGCGLIAMVTTFYHHSKFKIVEAPPNTQKNQPHAPHNKHLPHQHDHADNVEQAHQELKAKDGNSHGHEGGQVQDDRVPRFAREDQQPVEVERNLHWKQEEVNQGEDTNLHRARKTRDREKKTEYKRDAKVLGHSEGHVAVGGSNQRQSGRMVNNERGLSLNREESEKHSQQKANKADTGGRAGAKENNRKSVIREKHSLVKEFVDTRGEIRNNKSQRSHFIPSDKFPSHKMAKNFSRQHMERFKPEAGVNQLDDKLHQDKQSNRSWESVHPLRFNIHKGDNTGSDKDKYGIPNSSDLQKYWDTQLRESQHARLVANSDTHKRHDQPIFNPPRVEDNNIVIYDKRQSFHERDDKDNDPEDIHRKQIETNVIIVNPGRNNEAPAPKRPPEKLGARYTLQEMPLEFIEWSNTKQMWCTGHMSGYSNEFMHLRGVVVDRAYFSGRAGGEDIEEVLNQPEEDEYYKYDLGCFQLSCDERPDYFFIGGMHLSEFLFNLKTKDVSRRTDATKRGFTVVVTRYEYANIYHTMTDWYNAFLMMRFFNKTREETNILLVDAHPKGALDSTWGQLFGSSTRLSELKSRTRFTDMVWGILGYDSLMLNHYLEMLPLIDDFHRFFLSGFNIETKRQVDCDRIKVLFIWRKDYLAHPRNPSGTLSRKIKNEKELLRSVRKRYPNFSVDGVQIDVFPMEKQLNLIAQTDILIGMHGAGLTHTMFLPSHAGLIELVPSYWSSAMDHFMAIAQWRHLHYERWVNNDPHDEVPNESTLVPPGVVQVFIKSILRKMKCIEELDGAQYEDS